MAPEEITRLINLAKDAVDRSCFGPLFIYPNEQDITHKQVNALAFQVYNTVLNNLLRGVMDDQTT